MPELISNELHVWGINISYPLFFCYNRIYTLNKFSFYSDRYIIWPDVSPSLASHIFIHTHNLLDLHTSGRKYKYSQTVRDRELSSCPWSHLSLETSNLISCGTWSSVHSCCCYLIPFCNSELPSRPWILVVNSLLLWDMQEFILLLQIKLSCR